MKKKYPGIANWLPEDEEVNASVTSPNIVTKIADKLFEQDKKTMTPYELSLKWYWRFESEQLAKEYIKENNLSISVDELEEQLHNEFLAAIKISEGANCKKCNIFNEYINDNDWTCYSCKG